MREKQEKKGLSSFAPLHSETGDDLFLRQIFAAYDRFSPILVRFFKKELAVTVGAALLTVEKTTFSLLENSPRSNAPLFRVDSAEDEFPLLIEGCARFLFAVVDRLLGSERFAPEPHAGEATELDRRLLPHLIDRLTELFLGFGGLSNDETVIPNSVWITGVSSALTVHPQTPPTASNPDVVYYLLHWEITYQGETFPLIFSLPEDRITTRTLPNFTAENGPPSPVTAGFSSDLSHYIEARRTVKDSPILSEMEVTKTEKRSPDKVKNGLDKETEQGRTEIRVLAGTLKIAPGELSEMKQGDLLVTDLPISAPFLIRLDGIPVFWGRPGEFHGESAIEIIDHF